MNWRDHLRPGGPDNFRNISVVCLHYPGVNFTRVVEFMRDVAFGTGTDGQRNDFGNYSTRGFVTHEANAVRA